MKITFLGTSHGDPTMTRQQSATLIETRGKYYVIDAGAGVTTSLIRMGIRPDMISGIFITHMHIDHAGELPLLLEQALKYRTRTPEIEPVVRLPQNDVEKPLRAWLAANMVRETKFTDIRSYEAGLFYQDEFISLEAFPTNHAAWSVKDPSKKSYSFRLVCEGKKVQFTGDLTGDFSDFPFEASSGADLLVSELVHFPIEAAYERMKDLKIGKLIFTHLGNKWQTPEGKEKILETFRSVPYPVTVGCDGLQIEL